MSFYCSRKMCSKWIEFRFELIFSSTKEHSNSYVKLRADFVLDLINYYNNGMSKIYNYVDESFKTEIFSIRIY